MFASKTSLVLTNVPGPDRPVYFAGTKVAGVIPWVPGRGTISLGLSLFSYNGTVTIGVRADAGVVPQPEAILVAFQRELADLAALPPRSTAPH